MRGLGPIVALLLAGLPAIGCASLQGSGAGAAGKATHLEVTAGNGGQLTS